MIVFLSNADTEILALRTVIEGLPADVPPVRAANPSALGEPPSIDGATAVLVRLLGGRRAWEAPFDELRRRCIDADVPLLAFGGEAVADAELTWLSTAPAATVARAFEYLVHGGPANIESLLRFVAGVPCDPPQVGSSSRTALKKSATRSAACSSPCVSVRAV